MKKNRKILWFSSVQFSDEKIKTTGTWLIAMGNVISNVADIELYNCAYGDVKSITRKDASNITQWIIPRKERLRFNRGSKKLISFIRKIDHDLKPDLIHVWGTESGFGFPIIEARLQTHVLLDIQGLLFSIGRNYYGGLSNNDLIRCIGLKELLRPQHHPYFTRRRYDKRGKHERFLIRQMKNISVQSDWVHSIIRCVNPACSIFQTGIMLRHEYYETLPWVCNNDQKFINIFTSSSSSIPYKGLQLVFEAIALLKVKYPNIKLKIGGDIEIKKKYGCIRNGYTSWLLRKAEKLGIADSITWLGRMDAGEMINEMHNSTLVVIPSYVESYSLFMAEAMMVGVPVVASFTGAMPQLAEHNISALFFPKGDHWACARQIEKIIVDPELAGKLSLEARSLALQRNDQEKVLQTQLDIYNKII